MSEMAPTAHGVLEYLIKSLVNDPEEVHIESSGEDRCVFSVTVAEEDMGRVIGRRGRVANAQSLALQMYTGRTEACEMLQKER